MDFCTKLGGKMHQGHADCGEDHMTKSRNRKLTRVTSSIECLKYMCVEAHMKISRRNAITML